MLFSRDEPHALADLSAMVSSSDGCPDLCEELEDQAVAEDEAALTGMSSGHLAQYQFAIHIVYHRSYQEPVLYFRAYNMGEVLSSCTTEYLCSLKRGYDVSKRQREIVEHNCYDMSLKPRL